jgi:hypothetical protein
MERVATTETGAKAVVGNPPMGRLCSFSLLLRRLSLLLCALLLRRLSLLLCALLLLRRLSLLLRRLSLLLRRLSLLLRRFGLLLCRSRLLLCRLLLFAVWCLRVSTSNGSGKQEETCYC